MRKRDHLYQKTLVTKSESKDFSGQTSGLWFQHAFVCPLKSLSWTTSFSLSWWHNVYFVVQLHTYKNSKRGYLNCFKFIRMTCSCQLVNVCACARLFVFTYPLSVFKMTLLKSRLTYFEFISFVLLGHIYINSHFFYVTNCVISETISLHYLKHCWQDNYFLYGNL